MQAYARYLTRRLSGSVMQKESLNSRQLLLRLIVVVSSYGGREGFLGGSA